MRLDEKILDYVKRTGPCTPIEVAGRVGSDSIIVAAILVDAASQQKIKRSKRRVAGNRYYYYPEQVSQLQKRINSILTPQDKEMVQRIMNEKIMCELSISPQDISILSGLEDLIQGFTFEYDNRIVRGWSSPNIPEEKAREDVLKKIKPAAEVVKEEPKKEPPKPEPKPPSKKEPEVKKKTQITKSQRKAKKKQNRKSSSQKNQKKKATRKRKPKKTSKKK